MKCWCREPATVFYRYIPDSVIFGVCEACDEDNFNIQLAIDNGIYERVSSEDAQLYEIKGAL